MFSLGTFRSSIRQKQEQLNRCHADLTASVLQRRVETIDRELSSRRDLLNDLMAELMRRRRCLLGQLMSTFPVTQSVKDPSVYYVCGLALPSYDLESMSFGMYFEVSSVQPTYGCLGQDPEQIATALGWVVLLLQRIASYYSLVLRYPVHFEGSRSWILDSVSADVNPLFPSTRKPGSLQRAVLLLNRNIEQVEQPDCSIVFHLRNVRSFRRKAIESLS